MQCPCCGAATLYRAVRDIPYTYKRETTIVPAVSGDYCSTCHEFILDKGEDERTSVQLLEFKKQMEASFVDPGFIASVRKKLALDQKEAAAIFGGGVNAFSRYENGKTRPPVALVKLLKLLDRHPDLLAEVRTQ